MIDYLAKVFVQDAEIEGGLERLRLIAAGCGQVESTVVDAKSLSEAIQTRARLRILEISKTGQVSRRRSLR
jgi:hypothetical protein